MVDHLSHAEEMRARNTGTFTGGFTWDTSTDKMTNINVTVSGPTGFAGTYQYTNFDNSQTATFQSVPDVSLGQCCLLELTFNSPPDGSPGLVELLDVAAFNLPGHGGWFDNGINAGGVEVAATPLPAALPLFATGLGGLGLLGWRRKRKAQAVA